MRLAVVTFVLVVWVAGCAVQALAHSVPSTRAERATGWEGRYWHLRRNLGHYRAHIKVGDGRAYRWISRNRRNQRRLFLTMMLRWRPIVDCESGDGSASWPWSGWWGYNLDFEGGVNFVWSTWTEAGGRQFAEHAYQARPVEQLIVAERVLRSQGWIAWPVCSDKAGYR